MKHKNMSGHCRDRHLRAVRTRFTAIVMAASVFCGAGAGTIPQVHAAGEVIPVAEPVAVDEVTLPEEIIPVAEEAAPVTEEVVPVTEEVVPAAEEVAPVEEIVSVTEAEEIPATEETETVTAYDASLPKATGLKWLGAGILEFKIPTENAFYFVELQKDGEREMIFWMGAPVNWEEKKSYQHHWQHDFIESGDYRFRVKTGANDNDSSFTTGVITDWSPVYHYTRPKDVLPAPKNVRWSSAEDGVALWDGSNDPDVGYGVSLYRNGVRIRTSFFWNDTSHDFLRVIGDAADADAEWTFDVFAYYKDPAKKASSAASARSAPLKLSETTLGKFAAATGSMKAAANAADARAAVENMQKDINIKSAQLAMQTTDSVRKNVRETEELYKSKADVNVTVDAASSGLDNSKVSVLGAAMNARPGAQVVLNVAKADKNDNHVINTNLYKNVVKFDMNLNAQGTEYLDMDSEGNLKFPVEITMPLPKGINKTVTTKILHYHRVGNGYDLLTPRFNGDGTVSFTITHFSVFAFANEVTATSAKKGEWKQSNKKWWYQYSDGTYPKNRWEKIDEKWYYFDKSGYMKTGWVQDGKKWYYMDKKTGAMKTGWVQDGKKWYYMDKKSGAMKTGWVKDGKKWYYMDKKSGAMKKGWVQDGKKWYYMNGSGEMLASTSRTIKGTTYRFNAKGVCVNP